MNNTNTKTILIDPPSGWKYGFPKKAPANIMEMNDKEFNEWLIANGYPRHEVDYWVNSPKFGSVPCRRIEG